MNERPELSPAHYEMLTEGSGILPEVVAARGYRTITDESELEALGYADYQRRVPGLLIPIHTPGGDQAATQYRPDNPRLTLSGKPRKYEHPAGGGVRLDVPPSCRKDIDNPSVRLYITEGAKKADALASRGLCALALSGVWNFRGTNGKGGLTTLGDWDDVALNDRQVSVVFDSDVMEKEGVQQALDRLSDLLKRRKAKTQNVFLPSADGQKVGIDDYLVNGGTIESLDSLSRLPATTGDNALAILNVVNEFDADELDALTFEGEVELVSGVFRDAGINMLVADGGLGKSLAVMDLCIRVVNGGSAFGNLVSRTGGVLYLGTDVPKRDAMERMHRLRLAAGCEGRGEFKGFKYIPDALDFSQGETFEFILEKAEQVARQHETGKCALIVIDSFSEYAYSMNESATQDMGGVMVRLRLLAERTGACIIIIHHPNKNELATGSNRTRGSTVLPNASDVVVQMMRRGDAVVAVHTKNRTGPHMAPLTLTIVGEPHDLDDPLIVTFLPATAGEVGDIMSEIVQNAMLELVRRSQGEPMDKQDLFMGITGAGSYSKATKERAWKALHGVPECHFGTNGRRASVTWVPESNP